MENRMNCKHMINETNIKTTDIINLLEYTMKNRIMSIDEVLALAEAVNLLKQHDSLIAEKVHEKIILETDEERQIRLKCNFGNGINNWRCKVDCAFWSGERCDREMDEIQQYSNENAKLRAEITALQKQVEFFIEENKRIYKLFFK